MTLANRTNTLLLLLLVLMAGAIITMLATRAYGGPLDPTGPPGSTLPQIEERIPISSLPFTITQPGSYFVTKDLVGDGASDGITINADDVRIDLNGFTLHGTNSRSGVKILPGRRGDSVMNGGIASWDNGIDTPSATGGTFRDLFARDNNVDFDLGFAETLSNCNAGDKIRMQGNGSIVRNCAVYGALHTGIEVGGADNLIEDNLVVHNNASATPSEAGIIVDGLRTTVRGNTVDFNGQVGIAVVSDGNTVVDNVATGNGTFDVSVSGNNNLFLRNRVSCAKNFSNTGLTNSINIDFAKDGTNVCLG